MVAMPACSRVGASEVRAGGEGEDLPSLHQLRHGADAFARSPATLTTPGAVAAFCEAHARMERLPFARCLQDAIHYAGDGFPVSARVSRWIEQTAPEMDAASRAIFLPGGHAPRPGQLLKNQNLANTLRAIAAHGRAGFYEGEVAKQAGEARRLLHRARPRGAGRVLGRADPRHLPRRHHLRDAGADAGLHGARDAEPARAARLLGPFLGPITCTCWCRRSRSPITTATAGSPIRASRRADGAADLKSLRRRKTNPDRSKARAAVGQGALLRQPDRRHGVRGRGRRARQRRLADLQPLRRVRLVRHLRAETGVVLQNRGAYFSLDPKHPNRSSRARCRCTR
jgi:hypothetical protein